MSSSDGLAHPGSASGAAMSGDRLHQYGTGPPLSQPATSQSSIETSCCRCAVLQGPGLRILPRHELLVGAVTVCWLLCAARCPQPDCRHEMDVAALSNVLGPDQWTALLDLVSEPPVHIHCRLTETHTTHVQQGAAMLACPGSERGSPSLLLASRPGLCVHTTACRGAQGHPLIIAGNTGLLQSRPLLIRNPSHVQIKRTLYCMADRRRRPGCPQRSGCTAHMPPAARSWSRARTLASRG